MRFEFATANRIIFGRGTAAETTPLAASMGKRACVVVGADTGRAGPTFDALERKRFEYIVFDVPGEPSTELAWAGVQAARQADCDLVIGIGGGSVIDTGKVIAAMLTNGGNLTDYLEVLGAGKPLAKKAAPHIAVPTTAGTGAEVTRNAVLSVPAKRVKVSMRSPLMLPTVALVDSELTYSLPPHITAGTGLDALTQLIEPYVSNQANPLTDALCLQGIERAARALPRVFADGHDHRARDDMALASLYGGLALANAKLGAVHGFAGPLGGMLGAPHGVICGRLLPHVIEANVRALRQRQPDSPALVRFDEIGRILIGEIHCGASDAVRWIHDLCATFELPSLAQFGLNAKEIPAVVERAQRAGSMKGNPIVLQEDELTEILARAIG